MEKTSLSIVQRDWTPQFLPQTSEETDCVVGELEIDQEPSKKIGNSQISQNSSAAKVALISSELEMARKVLGRLRTAKLGQPEGWKKLQHRISALMQKMDQKDWAMDEEKLKILKEEYSNKIKMLDVTATLLQEIIPIGDNTFIQTKSNMKQSLHGHIKEIKSLNERIITCDAYVQARNTQTSLSTSTIQYSLHQEKELEQKCYALSMQLQNAKKAQRTKDNSSQ